MLRKFCLSLAILASFAFPLGTAAEAAVADSPFATADQAAQDTPVQDVNFIWGGRAYCWYPNGWRGAGFYVCGFQWSTGVGWGGGWGWNGWGGGWQTGWNGRGWHRGMTVNHHIHRNWNGNNRPNHNRPGHGHNRPGHGNNRPGHGGGGNRPGHGGGNRPGHGGGGGRPGHGGGNRPGHGGGGADQDTAAAVGIAAAAAADIAAAAVGGRRH